MSRFFLPLCSLFFLLHVVHGQTSLYIPGFDAQPVSAEIAGVDSELGRTTWLLHKGSASPGFTPTNDFLGTATLVQGSKGASLGYSNPAGEWAIAQDCIYTEKTLAVCTISIQGALVTQTEVVSRMPIQGGGTTSLAPTSDSGGSSSRPTGSPAPGFTSSTAFTHLPPGFDATGSTDGQSPEPSDESGGHQSGYQPFALVLSTTVLTAALLCL